VSVFQAGSALWAVFVASWQIAMVWKTRAVARTSWQSRVGDYLAYVVAFALLFSPWWRRGELWRTPEAVGWGLVGLEAASFAFAWWARAHLGRLWSGMITLREGHRVVDTGPYRLVRHPIYTGFLGAAWTYALASGAGASVVGAAALTAQMAWKARREERFLRQELGAEAYDAYAARTPMLIPFLPRPG
jgi:protein-S-isoprenylcysteine O-methyltransferase Ste14